MGAEYNIPALQNAAMRILVQSFKDELVTVNTMEEAYVPDKRKTKLQEVLVTQLARDSLNDRLVAWSREFITERGMDKVPGFCLDFVMALTSESGRAGLTRPITITWFMSLLRFTMSATATSHSPMLDQWRYSMDRSHPWPTSSPSSISISTWTLATTTPMEPFSHSTTTSPLIPQDHTMHGELRHSTNCAIPMLSGTPQLSVRTYRWSNLFASLLTL